MSLQGKLKRINVFFTEEQLNQIKKIISKAKDQKGSGWWKPAITISDIVRFSLAQTFGLDFNHVHLSRQNLTDRLIGAGLLKGVKK